MKDEDLTSVEVRPGVTAVTATRQLRVRSLDGAKKSRIDCRARKKAQANFPAATGVGAGFKKEKNPAITSVFLNFPYLAIRELRDIGIIKNNKKGFIGYMF